MSLTSQVEAARRRAIRRLALIATAGLAVLGVGVVIGSQVVQDDQGCRSDGDQRATASPTTTSTPPPASGDAGTWSLRPISDGPLILTPPTRTRRGVPLGYPHSTEGAISAAARYSEAIVTLDVERARTVARLAAAPSYLTAVDDFATNTANARKNLGVAAAGPTRGAFLTYQARGYRVMDAAPDRAEVWVLGVAEGAGPATDGAGQGGPSIARLTVVWVGGDWKFTDGDDTRIPRAPQPGSAEAYEEGWRDIAIA